MSSKRAELHTLEDTDKKETAKRIRMTHDKLSVGFVGCGMMASALMDGLIAEHVVADPASITCSDIFQPSLDSAAKKGVNTTKSNEEVYAQKDR